MHKEHLNSWNKDLGAFCLVRLVVFASFCFAERWCVLVYLPSLLALA